MTPQEHSSASLREFGARIEQLRNDRRLSKVKAAKAAGISDKYWAMFEAGARPDGNPFRPEAAVVASVADVVGIDPAEALRVYGIDPAFHKDKLGGRPTVAWARIEKKKELLDPQELAALEVLVDTILRAKGVLPPIGKETESAEADGVPAARRGSPAPLPDEGFSLGETTVYDPAEARMTEAPGSAHQGPRTVD
ncbi:helix-turn-helix domain-containing protein [Kutzneria albida]|uniref:HTH cro/C1-type domain-containing protein n=1 Tax=Kutzneria albida DSM 43870 TaxID=1449976 RepID=W5WCF7_9PSEU|nr:helix-turn-helix domain-containing protein [Kutzneria albida]AHH98206.1 hypothetical protein KALB_4844 [Kutzneria albida DSM 43870]